MLRIVTAFLLATHLAAAVAADPAPAAGAAPVVVVETSEGTIVLELFAAKAPLSAANFIDHVERGYYDGTTFHRVIPGFMIQGGGFTADMGRKEPGTPVKNEADNGLLNTRGTLAMARTQDPHSASSQFFINLADNGFLDHQGPTLQGWGYAVFGRVIEGMDVVDRISASPTGIVDGMPDVPLTAIVINKASLRAAP